MNLILGLSIFANNRGTDDSDLRFKIGNLDDFLRKADGVHKAHRRKVKKQLLGQGQARSPEDSSRHDWKPPQQHENRIGQGQICSNLPLLQRVDLGRANRCEAEDAVSVRVMRLS